jgi:EAL domain-containing protein (putative c-di-GMP-specific phosphodiesterase class I)
VPEQAILAARSGIIIEDLKNHDDAVERAPTTLEQRYGPEISQRMQQCIGSVLTTRRHSNLEFTMALHGAFRNFEAQFLVAAGDCVIIVLQDVTGEDQERGEIYDLAYFDSATSFPNRHLFMRAAGEAFTEARLRGASPVLFSLAFDNLPDRQTRDKDIMRAIAERLNACLSHFGNVIKMGRPDDAVRAARIDSNQFMFVLQRDYDGSDTRLICDRIFRQMAGQVPLDNGTVTIVPRLGIARYSTADEGLAAVMHSARSAMLEALEQNKPFVNRTLGFASRQPDGQDYASELRNALQRDQLELFFQPRLAMPSGRVTSVEALLRWNHPTLGFVDVRELLRVARDNELIVPIGEWVLHQACEAASRWRVHPKPRISINLSQQEFSRRDLTNRVIAVLEQTGLDHSGVELELTESMLMRNADDLNDLARLKETGASLVIDDFGTGHSSLANLRQYPVDALKIDQTFIQGLPGNHKDVAVCQVIVTMAHLFGMTAVAEGVETDAQLELLLDLGCDEFQGFHLCRPLPANEIEQYLLDLR